MALAAMVLPLGLAPAAQAAISATTGMIVKVAPPATTLENRFEHTTQMRAFDEKQDVVLSAPLAVDIVGAGTVDDAGDVASTRGTLAAGTAVDSHLLHADPVGALPPAGSVRYTGTVTFDADVIGVALLAGTLDRSDFLGAPGTVYPTGAGVRGLEFPGDLVVSDNMRTVTVRVWLHRLDQIRVITRGTPPPPQGGGEGCTPGYWKQPHHFDSWSGYAPTAKFETVFARDAYAGNPSLVQALGTGGGGLNALGRHAVAALLNASSAGVDYRYTSAQVLSMYRQAFDSRNAAKIEATKNLLEAANQAGCPLN